MTYKYWIKYTFYHEYTFSSFIIMLKINAHIIDATTIIEAFNILFVIEIKNIGIVPKNNPTVVKPKASPGLSFNTLTISASVIDMVIEKNITPIKDTIIKLSPNNKNGIARSALIIPIRLTP